MYVQDNFITNKDLIQAVQQDDTFFPPVMETLEGSDHLGGNNGLMYHTEEAPSFAPFMFWDGWWNSPADTLKKQVIQAIWENPDKRDFDLEDVVGFEYWTRTYVPPQGLAPHVDQDIFQYAKNKIFNAPIVGCVWFGFAEADGGMLEIHKPSIKGAISDIPPKILEADRVPAYLSPPEERERIAYKPNRLIIFNSGRRFHEVTPTKKGTRQVMAINVWHKDKPPLGLTAGDFHNENK